MRCAYWRSKVKLLKVLGLGILVVLGSWMFSAFYRELFRGLDVGASAVHGAITSLTVAAACVYGIHHKK